jgi:hypothetical protein
LKGRRNIMTLKAIQAATNVRPWKTGIILAIILATIAGVYYYFFYSPYLQGISSSEEKLYQDLKTSRYISSLKEAEAQKTIRLFLYSIEKEDWSISSLFYDTNKDGTINTAFGPKEATPDVLKQYRKMFVGEKDPFTQEGGKQSDVGYIPLKGSMSVSLERKEGI